MVCRHQQQEGSHPSAIDRWLTGNEVDKVYKELPPGDPAKSLGKVERMNERLNMKDFVKLEDGLLEVLSWIKNSHI